VRSVTEWFFFHFILYYHQVKSWVKKFISECRSIWFVTKNKPIFRYYSTPRFSMWSLEACFPAKNNYLWIDYEICMIHLPDIINRKHYSEYNYWNFMWFKIVNLESQGVNCKNCYILDLQYYCFYCIFDQIQS